MVPPLRRKRTFVSYREDSSSDDEPHVGSDGDPGASRSRPRRSTRSSARSNTYGRHRVVSYRESSSEAETGQELQEIDGRRIDNVEVVPTPRVVKKRRIASSGRRTPKSNVVTRSKDSKRRQRISNFSKVLSKKTKSAPEPPPIPSDGVKPEWSTLPYQVLLQIFVYASHPIEAQSAHWLLNISRMCHNFVEPALTALYRSPPLTSLDKSHLNKFVESILEPQSARLYNYNNKVKGLELDVTRIPSYAPANRSLQDLGELVAAVPQVIDVDLFDPGDIPPYRRNRHSVRWHYPDGLFSSMNAAGVRLKSWRWNRMLLSKQRPMLWLKEVHESSSFKGLVNLTFSNFDEAVNDEEDEAVISLGDSLASALSVLQDLRGLTFECSTVLTGKLLSLLPSHLYRLNIINCAEVTSDDLQVFLVTHGSSLKELVLDHNQALDLSFLTILKNSCPVLEVLSMDLNYYNTFSTHHDSDPKYEDLLREDEAPSWPSSLRTLKLVYMRKWTSAAAETLFQSLVDAAEDLPWLRVLVLKAILDISWRDRAQFRDRWIGKLKRVFLRKTTPPSKHLVSIKAYRDWKKQQALQNDQDCSRELKANSRGSPPLVRQARRKVQVQQVNTAIPLQDEGGSPGWSENRLRPRTRDAESSGTLSSDEEQGSKTDETSNDGFMQAKCAVVDISIDNLRPREELFDEGDFLDEEVSGDEDWDEDIDDVEGGEPNYAW